MHGTRMRLAGAACESDVPRRVSNMFRSLLEGQLTRQGSLPRVWPVVGASGASSA